MFLAMCQDDGVFALSGITQLYPEVEMDGEVFATAEQGSSTEVLEPIETQDEAPSSGEEQQEAQVDLSARIKELEADLERERNRNRSRDGQQRARVAQETIDELKNEVLSLKREFRRNQIEQSEQDEERKRSRLQELDAEEKQSAEQQQVKKYTDRIADRMNKLITRADLPEDNPAVQEALKRWRSVKTVDDADDVYDYLDDAIEKELRKPPAEEQPKQPQRSNASRMAQGTTPSSTGGPPRATDDNIDRLYLSWQQEHPGRPNPYLDDYRHVMRGGRLADKR